MSDARLELEDASEELKRGVDETFARGRSASPGWPRRVDPLDRRRRAAHRADRETGNQTNPPTPRVARFVIPVDSLEVSLDCPPAISPDGGRLVHSAAGQLWVRALDELVSSPLEGTDGARCACWSPDGFQARHRLWTVSADGGRPVALCDAREEFTDVGRVAWREDGRSVFAPGSGSVYAISASGGAAVGRDGGERDGSPGVSFRATVRVHL